MYSNCISMGDVHLYQNNLFYSFIPILATFYTTAPAQAFSPSDKVAHPAFCVQTGMSVSPPLQMNHGRTTESPSAKPWDCCYVSERFNYTPALSSKLCSYCHCDDTFNASGLVPIQITSWSTQRMTQSHSSSSLRCLVLVIFLLFMCGMLLFYPAVWPLKTDSALSVSARW